MRNSKTVSIKLTLKEIAFLRDFLNVRLPANPLQTISQALSEVEECEEVEASLWSKVVGLCQKNDLPLENDAPDHVITLSGAPELNILRIKI